MRRILGGVLAYSVVGLAAACVGLSSPDQSLPARSGATASCPGVRSTGDFFATHLSFPAARGWQAKSTGNSLDEAAWALSSTTRVAVSPYDGYSLIPRLAPGQLLIVVYAYTAERGQSASAYSHGVRVRCLPLRIADATVESGWEGQPRPNIPQYQLVAWVNRQLLDAKVFFSSQDPPGRELGLAQQELGRLRIPEQPTHPPRPPSGVPEPPLS